MEHFVICHSLGLKSINLINGTHRTRRGVVARLVQFLTFASLVPGSGVPHMLLYNTEKASLTSLPCIDFPAEPLKEFELLLSNPVMHFFFITFSPDVDCCKLT